jgi:hypothetical protein
MRRENDILIEELTDETLVYDTKAHKVHCLNQTSALVWRNCDGRTSIAKLAKMLHDGANLPESEEMVQCALSDLAKCHLLHDHRQDRNAKSARWSRRDFARKLGVAAVLVPAVMTIITPTAAAAGSACTSTIFNGGMGQGNCTGLPCPAGLSCTKPADKHGTMCRCV